MEDREVVIKLVEIFSELDVAYSDVKHKLSSVMPIKDVNALYEQFYGTELGDTIKPLKNADTLLGEVSPMMIMYLQGVIDESELVKRFNRHAQKALSGISIEDYVTLVGTYLKAYNSPVNTLDDVIEVLKAKFMHPTIITC